MKYIVRFLIVILFFPTIVLLMLFFGLVLLVNLFYSPIYFICNGEGPYNSLPGMAFDSMQDYGYKFTHWLIKKGWVKDE